MYKPMLSYMSWSFISSAISLSSLACRLAVLFLFTIVFTTRVLAGVLRLLGLKKMPFRGSLSSLILETIDLPMRLCTFRVDATILL